jgi:hypothetical protein
VNVPTPAKVWALIARDPLPEYVGLVNVAVEARVSLLIVNPAVAVKVEFSIPKLLKGGLGVTKANGDLAHASICPQDKTPCSTAVM